jgi:hypothetical protein
VDSELEVGSSGQFDVLVRGDLVFSRKKPGFERLTGPGGFPMEPQTVDAVKSKLG